MKDIPKDAYRIFTGPDGGKHLHYIDADGSVMPLEPQARHVRLADGYYTRNFKLIRLSKRPGARRVNGTSR